MSKIPWKENKVLSIETRKGLYVLAQMIKEPYLVFYNIFRFNQNWSDVDLNNEKILFYTAVAREFINSSNIVTLKKIKSYKLEHLDKYRIHLNVEYRNVTLWKGTKNEIEFLIMGNNSGMLIEEDPYSGLILTKNQKIIKKEISSIDDAIIERYDLDKILFYPTLNERLYLCYKFGKKVDPLKDFAFNKIIPLDYEVYAKLYSGKMTESEWEEVLPAVNPTPLGEGCTK
jgi:hypothetical protein